MAMNTRAFWDPNTNMEINATIKTYDELFREMTEHIKNLTERIERLETAYMELKMLGSDPGKIEG
jgi:prefoldin subunit 5